MAAVLLVFLLAPTGLALMVLQSGDMIVSSGVPVMLSCSMASGYSMSSYTMLWYRQDLAGAPLEFLTKEYDQSKGRFQADLQASKNLFSLRIVEPLLKDSSSYYCAAGGQGDVNEAYFGKGTKLTVLEGNIEVTPPKVQLLRPSEEECRNQKDNNRKKTLVCVASGFYPDHVSVSWEQNGEEVKDGVATDTAALRPEGEQYYKISSRLRVSADAWFNPDTQFRCIVKFFDGTNYIITSDKVNGEAAHHVSTPTVNLMKPSEEECRTQEDNERNMTLVCVASDFYPDHVSVSWEQNGEEVKDGVATDTAALRPEGEQYYKISSRLRVSADDWFNPDTQFRCIVKFFDGTGYINRNETVSGEAAPVKDSLTREKYLRISQSAKLSYVVLIFKSCVYGAFVAFLLYKLQRSVGKLSH